MKTRSCSKAIALTLAILITVGALGIPLFASAETGTTSNVDTPTSAPSDILIESEDVFFDDFSATDNFDNFGFSYEEILSQ